MNILSQNIRLIRRSKGITYCEIQRETGISKGLLHKMEHAEDANPTIRSLEIVCDYLGIGVHHAVYPLNCIACGKEDSIHIFKVDGKLLGPYCDMHGISVAATIDRINHEKSKMDACNPPLG